MYKLMQFNFWLPGTFVVELDYFFATIHQPDRLFVSPFHLAGQHP
ncbi:hypothetical protein [Siminovitchia sp. 179-K 8D1 HS]